MPTTYEAIARHPDRIAYRDFVRRVSTGDIALYRGTSWYARAIRRWTGSPYSHAAMFVWMDAELWLFESMEGVGVRARPFHRYLSEDTRAGIVCEWFRLIDNRPSCGAMADYMKRRVGKRYVSPGQLAWSFCTPDWLRRLTGRPLNRNPERYFCSEIVADAFAFGLKCAGHKPELPNDPAATSPAAIAAYPWWRREGVVDPTGWQLHGSKA